MSTNARIIIKVRKEDIGKVKNFKAGLLPEGIKIAKNFSPYEKNKRGASAYCNAKVEIKGMYLSIHHHWDGDMLMEELKKYSTYEQALNLVLAGDVSNILTYCYDEPEGITPYYCRGEKWSWVKPDQSVKFADVPREEYNYIFTEGRGWHRVH